MRQRTTAADGLASGRERGAHWSFAQEMMGSLWLDGAATDERPARLSLRAECLGRRWPCAGEIDAADLVRRATVEGSLSPVFGGGGPGLVYDLSFSGGDGARYLLAGELRLRRVNPILSLTTLDGRILAPQARQIGRVTLRWDLRHGALAFLLSWRRGRR